MLQKMDLVELKKQIEKRKGSRIKLEMNKGKQKASVENGVISDVYPSIFIVQLYEGDEPSRKSAYSYVDILTNSVEITMCE